MCIRISFHYVHELTQDMDIVVLSDKVGTILHLQLSYTFMLCSDLGYSEYEAIVTWSRGVTQCCSLTIVKHSNLLKVWGFFKHKI